MWLQRMSREVSISDTKDGVSRIATCTAKKGSTCKVVLNAVEEGLPTIDLKTMPVKSLGTLAKEIQIDIDLPQKEGDSSIFSFTPTAGDFTGKELYLWIYKAINRPGTRLYGKTQLKIYRFIAGDKPTNWQKMGEFESTLPVESLKSGVATIKPDGTVLIPAAVQDVSPVLR